MPGDRKGLVALETADVPRVVMDGKVMSRGLMGLAAAVAVVAICVVLMLTGPLKGEGGLACTFSDTVCSV